MAERMEAVVASRVRWSAVRLCSKSDAVAPQEMVNRITNLLAQQWVRQIPGALTLKMGRRAPVAVSSLGGSLIAR